MQNVSDNRRLIRMHFQLNSAAKMGAGLPPKSSCHCFVIDTRNCTHRPLMCYITMYIACVKTYYDV